ncbi:GFA family protein, partial [Mesorhizobium sp. M7A.F.Ca.US.005.03.2.1]
MPLLLKGSCRCNAVRFEVESHTPAPFMLCYCSICRKQQGGGGFAINLGADNETLNIRGK